MDSDILSLAFAHHDSQHFTPPLMALSGFPISLVEGWIQQLNQSFTLVSFSEDNTPLHLELRKVDKKKSPAVARSDSRMPFPRHYKSKNRDIIRHGDCALYLTKDGHDWLEIPQSCGNHINLSIDFLFHLALVRATARKGMIPIHAAAFSRSGCRPLVIGDSGAGKSTLAASALVSGGTIVSDDHCLLSSNIDGCLQAHSLRGGVLLRPESIKLLSEKDFSHCRPISGDPQERTLICQDRLPHRFAESVVPNAIWFVSIDRRLGSSKVLQIDKANSLAGLIRGSNALFLSRRYREERDASLPILARFASTLPARRIRLGRDILDKPRQSLDRLISLAG